MFTVPLPPFCKEETHPLSQFDHLKQSRTQSAYGESSVLAMLWLPAGALFVASKVGLLLLAI